MLTMNQPLNLIKTPTRTLFAWAQLGYVGLVLFFEFFDLLLPEGGSRIVDRAAGADFVTLTTVALPIVAVLLATQVAPVLPERKLIAFIALIEYGVIVLFGLISFLLGLGAVTGNLPGLDLMAYVVLRLAGLAIAALAGFYVLNKWTGGNGSVNPSPPSAF